MACERLEACLMIRNRAAASANDPRPVPEAPVPGLAVKKRAAPKQTVQRRQPAVKLRADRVRSAPPVPSRPMRRARSRAPKLPQNPSLNARASRCPSARTRIGRPVLSAPGHLVQLLRPVSHDRNALHRLPDLRLPGRHRPDLLLQDRRLPGRGLSVLPSIDRARERQRRRHPPSR